MAVSLTSLGDNCTKVKIFSEDLVAGRELPVLPNSLITKGVVYELNLFRSEYKYSWDNLYNWLAQICGKNLSLTLPCVKTALSRINKKHCELSRNKHHHLIEILLKEPFFPIKQLEPASKATIEQPLATIKPKLTVRNVNKRLKRRDEKIKTYKSDIADLSKENELLQNRLASVQRVSEQNRVAVYRMNRKMAMASCDKVNFEHRLLELEENYSVHVSTLEATVKNLSGALDITQADRDELAEHITELKSQKVKTKQHSQLYLDGVQQCCIELMSLNVSMNHVEPVIRSVLHHLVDLEVDKLPKPATLVEMMAQMKGLACQQLAEKLTTMENLTLHSDGTSKFGQHYGGFQVSTPDSAYSLGLSEMLTGSAEITLNTLKMILADIELISGEGTGNKILACIKVRVTSLLINNS